LTWRANSEDQSGADLRVRASMKRISKHLLKKQWGKELKGKKKTQEGAERGPRDKRHEPRINLRKKRFKKGKAKG